VQFRPLHGSGSRVRPRWASWHRGGADARVGKDGDAARWPVQSGVVSSVRQSKAAGGAEGSGRLQSGVIEPGEVRGAKLKDRPWFWACELGAIAAGITGGAGRGGSRSHQQFRVILGSAAKLPE
jgi:hypothetical protein